MVFHRRRSSHLFYTLYVFPQCQTRVKLNHNVVYEVREIVFEEEFFSAMKFSLEVNAFEANRTLLELELHQPHLSFPITTRPDRVLHA